MESQQHSTQRNYICCQCGSEYHAKKYVEPTKRYCNAACKQKTHRAKQASTKEVKRQSRIEEQFTRFYKGSFGQWIIRECVKADTVCIMMGHTTDSLFELEQFHNRYYKCYGFNADERKSVYHRCHIQARKGADGSVGALHPLNLVIAHWLPNQQAGNKFISADAGLSIPAHKLVKKWQVAFGDTNEQIAKKVRTLLGNEFIEYLSQSSAIKMDQVHTLAQRIYNRQQKDTAVKKLEQRYTLAQLEQESLENLEIMDAIQRGKSSVSRFKPELYTRATLCVYADELERMAAVSPSQRHRDNCRFMLDLVRVLGIYIAQMETQQGIEHKSFLPMRDAEWKPLAYMNWQQPWGKPNQQRIDADHRMLIESITEHCYHALAGADIPKGLLRQRLLKRIDATNLVPTVQAPGKYRYEAFGTWEKFIESLYADAGPVWQSLLALDLCTPEQIEEARTGLMWSLQGAIEKARHEYRNSECFKRTYRGKYYKRWGWKGYPEHLEYPAWLSDLMLPEAIDLRVPQAA